MKHEIHFHEDYFEVRTTGEAESKGHKKFVGDLLSHENWRPGTKVLVDHSDLRSASVTIDEIHEVAQDCLKWKDRIGGARVAIIVARDVDFGMARMWEALTDELWEVTERIFKSRDEAITWLKSL